jgi:hypothetical protein
VFAIKLTDDKVFNRSRRQTSGGFEVNCPEKRLFDHVNCRGEMRPLQPENARNDIRIGPDSYL